MKQLASVTALTIMLVFFVLSSRDHPRPQMPPPQPVEVTITGVKKPVTMEVTAEDVGDRIAWVVKEQYAQGVLDGIILAQNKTRGEPLTNGVSEWFFKHGVDKGLTK